jgi:hypothetical protein
MSTSAECNLLFDPCFRLGYEFKRIDGPFGASREGVEDYAVSVIFLCLFDSEKGFDFLGSRAA